MTVIGLGLATVSRPTEIDVDFESLDVAADRLKSSSLNVAEHVDSARVTWQELRGAYQQPDTEETVWSAMDGVPSVLAERAAVFGRASSILADFAVEGRALKQRARSLEADASDLESQAVSVSFSLTEESSSEGSEGGDLSLMQARIQEHNQRVHEVNTAWEQLQAQTASDLDSAASGGEAEKIPQLSLSGGPMAASSVAGGFGSGAGFSVAELAQGLALSISSSPSSNVEQADEMWDDITSGDTTAEDMQNFYDHMAQMSPEEIEELREKNSTIDLRDLPQPSTEEDYAQWPDGEDGRAWWDSLDVDQQAAMTASFPLLVGNTRGVPSNERHEANHRLINNLLDNPIYDENTYPEGRQRLIQMKEQAPPPLDEDGERPLDYHGEGLDYVEDQEGERYLLSVVQGNTGSSNPRSLPTGQLSIGDPEAAEDVGVNVHGMNGGSFQENGIPSEMALAQQDFYARNTGEGSYASVAWMYDPPVEDANWENLGERISDWLDEDYESQGTEQHLVHEDTAADEASWRLAMDLDSVKQVGESQDGTSPDVHGTAHSYGTNTLVHALTRTDEPIQTVHLMGSSGIPTDVAPDASALNVDRTEDGRPAVAATESENDGVAQWGRDIMPNRIDPFLDEDWGAYRYSADSSNLIGTEGSVPVDGHGRTSSEGAGYLDEGTYAYEHRHFIFEIGFDNFNWDGSMRNDPRVEIE